MRTRKPDQSDQVEDFLNAYDYSTGLLRAWLGTYSVGVPAFLFTHESVLKKLAAQHKAAWVAEIFGLAIASQVAITFLNKYIEWGVYARNSTPKQDNLYTRICDKASEWIWIDAIADIATIGLLAWGSFAVLQVLVG